MADHDEPVADGSNGSGDGVNVPLSDASLLDMLDSLVDGRGRVAAAEALGVNYRTLAACCDSRHVSRRMRRALEEYRDTAADDGDDPDDEGASDIAERVVALERRVAALEEERRELREVIEAQAERLTRLERQVGALESEERQQVEAGVFQPDCGQSEEWRPPRRDHGLPDAGVVTLEERPDEEYAFGPAASLVAEWRELRSGAGAPASRVDRAEAALRRWELEIAMIGDFRLTLPPEEAPLDASRREDHLRWRREALEEARRELAGVRRLRLLRRMLTLGIWWR